MSTCCECGFVGAFVDNSTVSVDIETEAGSLFALDLRQELRIGECQKCGALNPTPAQRESVSAIVLPENDQKGFGPRITIRRPRLPRVTVRLPEVTVSGGGVTVKPPSVTVSGPNVTVEWDITLPPPQVIPESGPHPIRDVHLQCRSGDGNAQIFIVNNEDNPVLVDLLVEGMTFLISVEKKSERNVGIYKGQQCSAVQNRIIISAIE